jgi:voltage-gated potassium channel
MFDALVVTPIRIFFVLIFLGTPTPSFFAAHGTNGAWKDFSKSFTITSSWPVTAPAVRKRWTTHFPRPACAGHRGHRRQREGARARGSLGCAILNGDATRDKTLEAAGIATAKAMVISGGR